VALPLVLAGLYLALLALLAAPTAAPIAPVPRLRFDVVVPAHDEEGVVEATVASLLALDYPRELFRVWVVADNCSDGTAVAAQAAGARVLVRSDAQRRGKGQALAWAFEGLLAEPFADAFVIVDADSLVAPGLLSVFAARLEGGAPALQADYGVRNPDASWRTRLMTLAFALSHGVRSRARQRLGLSCGLRGNGMAVTRATLGAVPYQAFSIVEDIEYGIHLALAGRRVHYVAEAAVWGEMAGSERASRAQRRRWEEGRRALRRRYAWRLLRRAMADRSAVLLDLAIDLLVPPLTTIAVPSALGLAAVLTAVAFGVPLVVAPVVFAAACLGVLVYVARGCLLAGTGLADLLLWAPVFIGWKLGLGLSRRAEPAGEWVRTERGGTP
jgi:cellulose synthase/poly-beta-1,6-N-acetylglucosamine synthase-like glycosyltransferase